MRILYNRMIHVHNGHLIHFKGATIFLDILNFTKKVVQV